MNCNNYFDMTDQGDSFETWQGLRGPAGPQGPAGAPGAPGTSVELRGPVETTGDLPATASSSELWLVGSAAPYHGWFYNGEAWDFERGVVEDMTLVARWKAKEYYTDPFLPKN